MDLSFTSKDRSLLVMLGCGAIVALSIKFLVLDPNGQVALRSMERSDLKETIGQRRIEIQSLAARRTETERQNGETSAVQEVDAKLDMLDYLSPTEHGTALTVRTLELAQQEGERKSYSFQVILTGSFAAACDYILHLEKNRRFTAIEQMSLTPWETDSTQVHLELSGLIWQ